MKCPMKFNNPCGDVDEGCVGNECAWWVMPKWGSGTCAMTALAFFVDNIAREMDSEEERQLV